MIESNISLRKTGKVIQNDILKKGLLLASQDTSVGQACFENIAKNLSSLLEMDYVLVGTLSEDPPNEVKTIALIIDGKIQPNLKYLLKGTPCETVVGQTMCHFGDNVDRLFPEDTMLVDLGVKSYIGSPIFDMNNKGIGLLALMSRRPIPDSAEMRSLIQIYSARAGVEIDRLNFEIHLKQLNHAIESEVKKRTEKLESLALEAEDKYKTLFENNSEALVMSDLDRVVKFAFTVANKAAVTLFGARDVQELLTLSPMDLSPEYQPDGRLSSEKAYDMVNLGMQRGSHTFDWVHRKVSGEEFDCVVVFTCVQAQGKRLMQAALRDITKSKRAKEELLEKDKELEYAERVAKLGRWKWNIHEDKVEWSEVLKEIFGLKENAPIPRYEEFEHSHTPESLKRLHACVENAIKNGTPYELDMEIRLPDGTSKWIQGRGEVSERDSSGMAIKLAGTVQDITEQKKLVNLLNDALKARDVFLGVASHELKTPLTTLQLQIHSLLRILSGPAANIPIDKVISKLDIIKRQGDRFERLLKTLLDISQISSGKLKLQLEKNLNLSELAQDISHRYQEDFLQAESDYKINIQPDVKGSWDSQRLEQVISNLLSNALKYGAGNPVELIIRKDQTHAYIEVKDQGIGIAKDAHGKIFERFERAVSEHSYKGLGLGLWIVREIINSFNGEIWVESEVEIGSRFIAKLPLTSGSHDC